MAITISDIVVGGMYEAGDNQERRVIKIEGGKVHYESRGGNVKNAWQLGHNKSSPPSLELFAAACTRVILEP